MFSDELNAAIDRGERLSPAVADATLGEELAAGRIAWSDEVKGGERYHVATLKVADDEDILKLFLPSQGSAESAPAPDNILNVHFLFEREDLGGDVRISGSTRELLAKAAIEALGG